MAARKRPAAALDAGHETTTTEGSPACSKRSRASDGSAADDDYEEMRRLGEGGFGYVLRLRHRVTKKEVAAKFLSPKKDEEKTEEAEAADVQDLQREARFLEACKGNPYVVGFEGMVPHPDTGVLGLGMEYVDASSLQSLLWSRPPLPEFTVRAIMWKLLTGAKNMHRRHVVHRDIKPANILVGQDGELVKICDLGLAISMSDPPPYNQAGTAYYTAPEMVLGKKDYDALVDTWSLGCVMAEMLTGKTLFQEDDEDEDDETNNDVDDLTQLWSIFRVLGMPDERTWPEFASLPLTAEVLRMLPAEHKHNRLRDLFPEEKLSKEGFQVLQGLLTCNPDKRLTAAAALKHRWFSAPLPSAAAAKVDVPKNTAPRIKFIPPATPEKNVLKIPLAVWNAAQRV